jgi:hypothetical protein
MATVIGSRNIDGSITVDRVLQAVPVRSKRGTLKPEIANRRSMGRGKRRMSPWQAKAIGSGFGVVAPADMVFTNDPQFGMGDTFTGHSTNTQEY